MQEMSKKYLNLFVLAGLSLLSLVGCQKDGQGVTLKAKISPVANGADKLCIVGFSTYWTNYDAVFVNGQSDRAVSINDDGSAIIQDVTSSSSYAAVYPSSIVNSDQSVSAGSPVNITLPATQVYSQVDGKQIVSVPMAAYTTGNELDFYNLCSVVKVDVTNSTGAAFSLNSIEITATGARLAGAGVLTIAQDGSSRLAMSEGATNSVALSFITPVELQSGDHNFYYLVLPAFTERNIDIVLSTTSGEYSYQKTNSLPSNIIAKLDLTVGTAQEPPMSGEFTVNGNGSKVRFSPGNLQYIGSVATPYWQFAPHQWDVISTAQNSTADDPSKDRDLFGWGTSGWNNGNTNYQPYNTSYVSNRNGAYGGGYGPCNNSSYLFSLVGAYANADWGVYNQIRFGSTVYPAGTWRTLTSDEWSFILDANRPASTVGTVANARYVKIKVNGVNGLLLFPDVFTWPTAAGAAPSNVNNAGTPWGDVISYNEAAFESLQDAGCVFLPVAGMRDGSSVSNINTDCIYWSSTYTSYTHAYAMVMQNSGLNSGGRARRVGNAVRLVQNVVSQ